LELFWSPSFSQPTTGQPTQKWHEVASRISSSPEGQNPRQPIHILCCTFGKTLRADEIVRRANWRYTTCKINHNRFLYAAEWGNESEIWGVSGSLLWKRDYRPGRRSLPALSKSPRSDHHLEIYCRRQCRSARKTQASEYRTPRFAVGDQIIFVGLGPKSGKQGDVIEVIDGSLDYVHRYHVRLSDGTWIRCFGFELEFDLTSSKSA
jgi:hypothetical protein